MAARVAIVALLVAGAGAAHADAESPRLAALAKDPRGVAAFWQKIAAEGTPMVEDIGDAEGRLLVTFLYRARPDTKTVVVFGVSEIGRPADAQLLRVPGTDVFAKSILLPRDTRVSYMLSVNDPLTPIRKPADFAVWKRVGHIGVEMEAAMIYTIAAVQGIEALAIMTVSDLLFESGDSKRISDEELKQGVDKMMRIACQVAIS